LAKGPSKIIQLQIQGRVPAVIKGIWKIKLRINTTLTGHSQEQQKSNFSVKMENVFDVVKTCIQKTTHADIKLPHATNVET
jgi:hypothetical protein